MSEQPIELLFRTALWHQFGAAIDMFENAMLNCPAPLWRERLWPALPDSEFPSEFGEFWYVAFHTLIWLDLYLTGLPEEEFFPPPPFLPGEIDSFQTLPPQPYTLEELHTYLEATRQKCHSQLFRLTDEQMSRPVMYPWARGQTISYLELQLYNLRHVQGHAAQLSLFLGQHGIPDSDWVTRAKDGPIG